MIPVYDIENNLREQIEQNCSVKASCILSPSDKTEEFKKDEVVLQAIAAEYDRDLYPVSTVLASADWNKNDDVFDSAEIMAAKDTPIHKPLNKHHKPRDIVGHIISSKLVDDEYEEVEENCSHILAEGVVYRHLKSVDNELEEECSEFIEELKNGEWAVSMETLFSNFDYALKHPTLGDAVLARTEKTAFLTQYLRAYGGEGVYKGVRIGRILRNLTFCAEGFTKNPANPKSVVLNNNVNTFAACAAVTLDDLKDLDQGDNMSDNPLQEKFDEILKQNKELHEKLAVNSHASIIEENEKTIAKHEDTIAKHEETIEQQNKTIEDLTSSAASIEQLIKDADEKTEQLQKKYDEAVAELATIASANIRTNRISTMVDAGIDKIEAEALVDEFSGVDDAQFAKIVDLKKGQTPVVVAEAVEETDVEDDKDGEAAIAETVIEEVEDVVLASEVDVKDEVISEFSAYLTGKLSK